MKTLQRLYLIEFAFLLITISVMLSALFSVISIIEKMDELLPLGLDIEEIVLVGIARIPEFLGYLLPMATLLCCIFVLSLASRRNEITIIKASGKNIKRFFVPFLIAGSLLILIDFIAAEITSPILLKKSSTIVDSLNKNKSISYEEGNIWFKGKEDAIVRTRLFIPGEKELFGISIVYIKNGRLYKRIEAEKGSWTERGWRLRGVRLYDLEGKKVNFFHETLTTDIGEPEILEREKERLSEMGVIELIRYENNLKEAGYRNIKLSVDIQSKISYPFTNLFMLLMGILLSLKSKRGKGIVSAGVGILISLTYWVLFTMSLSLGYAGLIPPILSAWTLPVLSTVAALFLYLRIPL